MRFADDTSLLVVGITGRERHEDRVGPTTAYLIDIPAQVGTIAIDGIVDVLALVEACHQRVGINTGDHTPGALGIEEVGRVVMTDRDDHPVACLQGIPHSWPQVGIEGAGGHASQGLVLHGDASPVEILVEEISPSPLAVVAIAEGAVAHGGVADQEEYGVVALTGGSGCRT